MRMRAIAVLLLALVAGGCASAPVATRAATVAGADELPDGRGRQILLAACISCHDLREVTKFRGYYDRAQWRDVVVTMVEYGSAVSAPDVEVLADYLTAHLGRRVTAASP